MKGLRPPSSVLCLEVAEHFQPQDEPQLIETIVRYCRRWLVLSWAIPGQRGTGHRNCQTNQYVRDLLESRGFTYDSSPTDYLRAGADAHTAYFRNTLMVFRRTEVR